MSTGQYIFLGFIAVVVLLFLIQCAISYFCSCRDKEWIKWCEDNGFIADKWPEYGYGDD